RVTDIAVQDFADCVFPIQSMGFSYMESFGVAQVADFYLGRLDAFALLAIAAQQRGVYLPLGHEDGDGIVIGLAEEHWNTGAEIDIQQALLYLRNLTEGDG